MLERNPLGCSVGRRIGSVVLGWPRLMGGAGVRPLLMLVLLLLLLVLLLLLLRVRMWERLLLLLLLRVQMRQRLLLLMLLRRLLLVMLIHEARRPGVLLYLSRRRGLLRQMGPMLCHDASCQPSVRFSKLARRLDKTQKQESS